MATIVVNMKHEPYDVYIGRPGKGESGYFGNPFDVRVYGKMALPLYEAYFRKRLEIDSSFRRQVEELRGKRLGCFCVGKPPERKGDCHGKVIADWVDDHDNWCGGGRNCDHPPDRCDECSEQTDALMKQMNSFTEDPEEGGRPVWICSSCEEKKFNSPNRYRNP